MAAKPETSEDESFIILGTSPGTSLDLRCNGLENGDVPLEKSQIEDAMKELSNEASMAFKAHFKLGDCPSPASLMVASSIITEDKSTQELQKHFGEILDENVILKETLKQNNDSMKEQFLLIASCQEDMMKTHMLHKEKFDETKELVEKLRQENKKLKQDIVRLTEATQPSIVNSETGEDTKEGPSSVMEFVTSPDDDTINKLTAQLELVEKQRRQILTWQKESLEHIVDATTKERDELKVKVKKLELQLSSKDADFAQEIQTLKSTIRELSDQLQAPREMPGVSTQELLDKDATIFQLEGKVSALRNDLKNAQLKILDLENIKLEFTKHKSGVSEIVKIYKDQIVDLNNRLKEAQTTVFQPMRVSISAEPETSSSEYSSFLNNVKLYDRTLKHIAELFNALTHGLSDNLMEILGLVVSLQDLKLDRTTVEQFRSSLTDVKQRIEKQHTNSLNNIGQVRGTLSIFEGIFKDYNELLKKCITKPVQKAVTAPNVDTLTAALVARGQELQALEAEIKILKDSKEDGELLKAQLELYKSDFEAERSAREQLANARDHALTDLRTAQRRNAELAQQLEEVKKINPVVYRNAMAKKTTPQSSAGASPSHRPAPASPSSGESTTGNRIYTCPRCIRFKTTDYEVLEEHFNYCTGDDDCVLQ